MSLDQHLLDQARSKFKKIFYKNTLIYFPYQGESLRNSNGLSPRAAIILQLGNFSRSLVIDEYLVSGISSTYSISFLSLILLNSFPQSSSNKSLRFLSALCTPKNVCFLSGLIPHLAKNLNVRLIISCSTVILGRKISTWPHSS